MDEVDASRHRIVAIATVGDKVMDAARQGNAEELQGYLLAGKRVDAVDEFGKHVIHYICRYGLLPALHALLAVDPRQVYAADSDGNKAHHCAVERVDSAPVLDVLLQFDVPINVRNNDGLTPLHVAGFCGNAPAIQLLHSHGAALDLLTESDKTALHLAAQNGHADAIRALVDCGADVSILSKGGLTALHFASLSRKGKATEALLVAGADKTATTETGATPLYYAASYGGLECVEVLLHHNADANAVDTQGRSPMHCAAVHGHHVVFFPLIHSGGMLDLEDELGNTPMHYAAMDGHYDSVRCLVQFNAMVMCVNQEGETPLHVAAKRGHVKVVEQLCHSGSNVHNADSKGDTASHKAARQGHHKVLHYLLSVGAPKNQQNKAGDTCLHLAARYNHIQCVRVLLNENANISLVNQEGHAPLASSGAMARPMLEDWIDELSTTALMKIGPGERKDNPIVLYGNVSSGKTALFDSMVRHNSGGILATSETIYAGNHQPTLGIRIRYANLGLKTKTTRVVEVGGSHEYRPLRTLPLHLPRATHILVLDARLGYEELQAQATAWLDLARVCMSRKSVGWALRLRVPLLLVFSNADHSSVRVLKNPRNNMNSSNVSDRLYSELQNLYKEWFDFGMGAFLIDCRVPFSSEMDSIVDRLRQAKKAVLKESQPVPRVVEKVENQLIKIIKLAKTPWMPWKVFRDEACKKFFRGEDRNRVEAEVFMRRISQVLHKDMKVISFSEGPAKDFIVLSPAWFFEKVASQLLAPTSARTDMKPLTVDEQGHVFISEFESIINPLLDRQKMDGFLAILNGLNLLHVLSDEQLRILMPSRIPHNINAPPSCLPERSVFAGQRLRLSGVTARCVVSLMGGVVMSLLRELPGFNEVIWTLGARLMRQSESAMVEVTVELGEQRSHAMLLVYVMSNLVPSMAEEPMKKLLTRIMELVQLRLQADAPSIGIETAPLNEAQVPQVRRRSLEGNPGNVIVHRNSALLLNPPGTGLSVSPLSARRAERRLSSGLRGENFADSPLAATSEVSQDDDGTPFQEGAAEIAPSVELELEDYTSSPGAGAGRGGGFDFDSQLINSGTV